ncbi:uncharacterized protein SPAPADRAFT_60987 [Spathaspora passalidarum NRRL Y-27907]|uniref:Uncharacterized protein n=1 Tax=Spathaspora passalidarum (strain NRRL Y-27907 / 11-Y1) TaxID=619300 RepID=G3AN51_SPAPN|nr:uncharacterized protein SPAPADRAFT_60987 [Spathaspora passalidarum NRRL Y-27907]EGW31894.1 hypothetical protein SPAPADRAFT_60987 [Spathaspora passalidarum NRRL Y-27907]
MKLSNVVIGLSAAAVASAADEQTREVVTVTVTGTTQTHVWGRFDHTSRPQPSPETGTHRWGRFDHTSRPQPAAETGTHRWGRFDHTSRTQPAAETGTHRWGRFDHTKGPTTTTVFVQPTDHNDDALFVQERDVANVTNGTNHTTSQAGSAASVGINFGIAGALAVGVALIV